MSENLFKLTNRNFHLLKIFQICGFVPFPLHKNDGILGSIPPICFIIYFIICSFLLPFKFDTLEDIILAVVLITYYTYLAFTWLRVILSKQNFIKILRNFCEIDENFEKYLKNQGSLEKENQKTIAIICGAIFLTILFYSYNPIINMEYPREFTFWLVKFVPFMLATFRILQICFFYYLVAEKLKTITSRFDEIIKFYHIDRAVFDDPSLTDLDSIGVSKVVEVRRTSVDRIKNDVVIEKITSLKEIYQKCWECHNEIEQITSLSVLFWIVLYLLELEVMRLKILPLFLKSKLVENLMSKN